MFCIFKFFQIAQIVFHIFPGAQLASILEHIELEVSKVKEEAFSRKEILEKVEKWMSAREEEEWLEEYNQVVPQILNYSQQKKFISLLSWFHVTVSLTKIFHCHLRMITDTMQAVVLILPLSVLKKPDR